MESSRKLPSTDPVLLSLQREVATCLARHLDSGQHLVVGLSGGVDSVTLLNVIVHLQKQIESGFSVSAVHVNHGISPSANHWQIFCEDYCRQLGITCASVRVNVDHNSPDGLEAAARRARYAALAEIEGDWVVLAHHLNDQAETALFNLLRGTGLAGAAAMNECSGRLLRPWLAIGCDAIEHYARQSGLDWCEDESNIDNDFSRNFLRNAVFPLLEGRFPAAIKNIAGASSRFREALRLLDDLARLDLRGTDCFPVHVEILSELDEARGRNALRYLLANAGVQIPSEARLREVLRQMISAGPDRHPTVLFGRYNLFRHKRAIHLELAPDSAESR